MVVDVNIIMVCLGVFTREPSTFRIDILHYASFYWELCLSSCCMNGHYSYGKLRYMLCVWLYCPFWWMCIFKSFLFRMDLRGVEKYYQVYPLLGKITPKKVYPWQCKTNPQLAFRMGHKWVCFVLRTTPFLYLKVLKSIVMNKVWIRVWYTIDRPSCCCQYKLFNLLISILSAILKYFIFRVSLIMTWPIPNI